MTPAEEAAAKESADSKGVVKFGWIKGVLVSQFKCENQKHISLLQFIEPE